jgi:hypothetical protein
VAQIKKLLSSAWRPLPRRNSEARTKKQAEQAESKIKHEIFEGRFGLVHSGTMKLAKFIDEIYMPLGHRKQAFVEGRSVLQRSAKGVFQRQIVMRDHAALG